MATSVVNPRAQFFANNGRPLIGGRIHTYVAGSSTRARTYKDAGKAQPNTNPIILDGRGEAQIYLAEGVEYKFVVEDSKGALIYTQEPVYGAIWPNAADWPSDATLSYQYMTEAKAAAGAIGPIKFYEAYSEAAADIAVIPDDGLIEVLHDENHDGARTRYFKRAGDVLEFAVNLDQLRLELLEFSGHINDLPEFSNVPAHSNVTLDVQAQALANRTEYLERAYIQPLRAYRRKPIPFPPVNQYTSAIIADGGQYFPNSMVIDDQEDEVFFITNSPWWVQVYDFHTREIKTVFKLSTGGSEGASIYRKDGRRYLVRRGQTQFMEMFDITDLPAPMSTVAPASTSTFKVGTNFAVRGDYLYTTMHGRAKGNNIYQRNIIDVIDLRTSERVSRLILDPAKTGFSNQQITTFPKMQGFDVMGGYLLLANGSGGYNHTTDTAVNPSRMQGFRVLASDGSIVAECFFDPKSMGDKLLSLGYRYQYQECEGMQFAYGRIYSMFAVAGKEGAGADQEGWMLFEEMSEAPDAIDFSDCAAFVPSSTQRYYSSTYPCDVDTGDNTTQTFKSMYDGSQITSVAGFFEMMYQLQMDSLTISTRGTTLNNGLGASLAASGILRLYNQDNEYFLAELINYTGNTAGYNVYAVRTGENAYTFTRNNPDYWDGNLAPREVGTQDLGVGVRVWNNVFGNRFGPSSTRMIQWGSGNPNGVVAASYGAVFFNTGGGAGETMWVKETGGGTNTGWVAK